MRTKAIVSDLQKWGTSTSARSELAQWRLKRRRSSFWCVSVKLISETCPLPWQNGYARSYCASPSMQVKETCVARGTSPFITKAGTSPIPYIERRVLEWRISVSYPPLKVRSQLGQNSDGARSCPVLTISFPFWMPSPKILWWWSIILVRVSTLLLFSPTPIVFAPYTGLQWSWLSLEHNLFGVALFCLY
jgi:hypothetical protein